MKILSRYILIEHIGPFLFGFSTVIFVFLLQFLMRYLDRFVGKGLDMMVIVELIILQIAWMVVLAAPMAVLISTLMTFGNFTNSSEMTAIRASGVSLKRIMLPVVLAGMVITLLVERFNNVVLPEANHQAKVLLMDISRTKPSFGLEENVFTDMIRGYEILARHTSEKSSDIAGVTIYKNSNDFRRVVITADSGSFTFTKDYRNLIMTLKHGEMHEITDRKKLSYRKIKFETHKVVFEATGFGFERTDENNIGRGDRELSAMTMLDICDSLNLRVELAQSRIDSTISKRLASIFAITPFKRQKDLVENPKHYSQDTSRFIDKLDRLPLKRRQKIIDHAIQLTRSDLNDTYYNSIGLRSNRKTIKKYMVEVHKKYALPVACLLFVFVGVPLGVLAKRGGVGVGAGFSLLFYLIYWVCLIGGEKLADREILSPWLAMWMGNFVIGVIGAVILYQISGKGFTGSR